MVDKLYDNWMNLCPQFKTDFGTLTPDYRLNPFPRTVGQISDIRANGFCYSYSRSAGDNPAPKITCPGAAPTPTVAITVSGTQTITIEVPGPTPTSQVNDVWLQMWTQTLILGVNRFRVDPTKLDTSAAMAKRISIGASFKAEENTTAIVKPHHKVIKAELIGSITAPNSKYVPLPQYFFNPDFKVAAPLQEDDTDLVNIRPPTFIEKELLEKMHFDHKLFGEVVNFAEMIDDQYNNLPGRTSAAALCNTLDRTIQLPNK